MSDDNGGDDSGVAALGLPLEYSWPQRQEAELAAKLTRGGGGGGGSDGNSSSSGHDQKLVDLELQRRVRRASLVLLREWAGAMDTPRPMHVPAEVDMAAPVLDSTTESESESGSSRSSSYNSSAEIDAHTSSSAGSPAQQQQNGRNGSLVELV